MRLAFSGAWAVASAHLRIMLGLLAMQGLSTAARAFAFRNRAVRVFSNLNLLSRFQDFVRGVVEWDDEMAVELSPEEEEELAAQLEADEEDAEGELQRAEEEAGVRTRNSPEGFHTAPASLSGRDRGSGRGRGRGRPAAPRAMMQLQLGGGIPRPRAPIT